MKTTSRLVWILAAAAGVPMLAHAQSATGTWEGERTGFGRQGGGGEPQTITVVLNADGTGTFKQGDQEAEELSEVKIEGTSVSFQRMPNFAGRGGGGGGGEITLTYTGEVDGDTLTLEMAIEGAGGFGGGGGGGGGGFEIPPLVLTRQ